jgi:hypothetical protein
MKHGYGLPEIEHAPPRQRADLEFYEQSAA